MRRGLTMGMTVAIAAMLVTWGLAGPAFAPPVSASCSLTAANPTADVGATLTASGTGSCVGLTSIQIWVCLQAAQHTAGGTSWSNLKCSTPKTPSAGTTVSVSTSWSCVVGHSYQVRSKTVGSGTTSSGSTFTKSKLSSSSGVTRTCRS